MIVVSRFRSVAHVLDPHLTTPVCTYRSNTRLGLFGPPWGDVRVRSVVERRAEQRAVERPMTSELWDDGDGCCRQNATTRRRGSVASNPSRGEIDLGAVLGRGVLGARIGTYPADVGTRPIRIPSAATERARDESQRLGDTQCGRALSMSRNAPVDANHEALRTTDDEEIGEGFTRTRLYDGKLPHRSAERMACHAELREPRDETCQRHMASKVDLPERFSR